MQMILDLSIILLLIAGIWQFRTPPGARRGNLTAALALLCAGAAVVCRNPVSEPVFVLSFLALGAAAGCGVALRVSMLHIPAMVAFQHGAGGIAALLVSFVELTRDGAALAPVRQVSGMVGLAVGAATASGSFVAAAKLAERMRQTPIVFPKHGRILLVLGAGLLALGVVAWGTSGGVSMYCLLALSLLAVALGAVFAVRVGGADMPVLISFLNATAGLAAALCGIVIGNRLLIACGATVAASGSILTRAMCVAMNRSVLRVFAGVKAQAGGPRPPEAEDVRADAAAPGSHAGAAQSDGDDPLARVAEAARRAKTVIVVPGYGMALSQAQFELARLAARLEAMGKHVRFAIHPVAGRMPGHMNVLLAEAEIDYGKLLEMDEVNPLFRETDLVLVVGACDVVNPAAIRSEGTPISGMPILEAHEAATVAVLNLDRRPGYSGVENPLYGEPRTILLLGDAKANLGRLLESVGT